MTADQFVEAFNALPPTYEEFERTLKEKGKEGIHLKMELIQSQILPKNSSKAPQSDDPIIDFVERYDIKHDYFGLSIGFISFLKELMQFEFEGQLKIHFADTQYEYVVINEETGVIETIDREGASYPSTIAKSSAHFLEALLHLKALGKYSSTLKGAVEKEVWESYGKKTAIASGYPEYFETYLHLSGIWIP